MRLAAKVTLAAYEATYRSLKAGMTRKDVGRCWKLHTASWDSRAARTCRSENILPFRMGSILPQDNSRRHDRADRRRLLGGGLSASDITRTFVLGKASDKMKQVFDIVHRAQSAALATARPGVEAGSVDAAARKVITDAGYGPDYKYFTHRLGHGMGMDGHEWPYLVRGNTTKLQPQMTFSDEPGIYIRGEFGIRLEDDMHILENGAELFTPQSPSLENPFAKM